MSDHLSAEQRSWNMSRILSKNTTPEKTVRSILHNMGYRFRIHLSDFPGKPDIVLKKYKKIIFCNGCFWHQHPGCIRATIPKTNTDYWIPKLEKNVSRFNYVVTNLRNLGWNVSVIWECETKNINKLSKKLYFILNK